MSERTAGRPRLDEGDPPTTWRALWGQLTPVPGRMNNTLLLMLQVTITLIVGEVFRVPQLSVFVWIAFFLSGNDAVSSLTLATLSSGMILLGTGLVILFLMFSLSEPALRLPIMFLLTFGAGFLSQAMTMGMLANVLLFWIVYMATNADTLETVGYGLDAFVGNTPQSAIPDAAFLPPEEALLHMLLWIGAVFAVALLILIVVNLAFGRDPAVMLRAGIVARLRAVAKVLGRAADDQGQHPAAGREGLAGLAQEGVAGLRKLHGLTAKIHREPQRLRLGLAMIRNVGRLVMVTYAWTRLPDRPHSPASLKMLSQTVNACADALGRRKGAEDALAAIDPKALNDIARSYADDPQSHPLVQELTWTLTVIRALLLRHDRAMETLLPEIFTAPKMLFKDDAFRNPAYCRGAVKLLLSVSICYAIERFANWPGIGTCVVTCFLVSLGTVGDSVHKMTLRVGGALAGAVFGIGSILWVMPYLTDITDLLLLILPVSFLAAWVKCGSERIAYAGVQMAFAFYLCVLQGYGPTLDMETGRDRVIGILIGNVVVYLVSVTIWPVSVKSVARGHLVTAISLLGKLVSYRQTDREKTLIDSGQERLRERFGQAIAAVRNSVLNDQFEPHPAPTATQGGAIDARVLTEIQMLSVPIAIVSDAGHGLCAVARKQIDDLQDWLDRFGLWVAEGRGGDRLLETLPPPPSLPDDAERQYWFGVLDMRIRTVLAELLPASVRGIS